MQKKYIGFMGLLMVAVIWGSGFVASDIALKSLEPLKILFFRFMIAAILMGVIAFKKLIKIKKEECFQGCLLGALLFLAFALQTVGLQYTTPSKNAFLTSTNVVIVPFIAWVIYKKKADTFSIVGAVFAILGIGLLSLNGNLAMNKGDMLTLLCAVCFAFHIFLTAQYVNNSDYLVLTAVQMIVAFFMAGVSLALSGRWTFHFTAEGVGSVLYLGIFSTTIAFFLQMFSQKYMDETTAAVILSMESVFGTLFSMILLHEKISIRMMVGCVIILAGVVISETKLSFGRRNNV